MEVSGRVDPAVEIANARAADGGRSGRRVVYHEVLGAHLRNLRRVRKVKLAAIAKRFDVSVARLTKVENGTRGPSPATLEMYSEVLQVPLLDLLADVADRYRELLDPFDPALGVRLSPCVRSLHGLALYAGIPTPDRSGAAPTPPGRRPPRR
jgi:transcriptional regulator with XRE-family HTH domain